MIFAVARCCFHWEHSNLVLTVSRRQQWPSGDQSFCVDPPPAPCSPSLATKLYKHGLVVMITTDNLLSSCYDLLCLQSISLLERNSSRKSPVPRLETHHMRVAAEMPCWNMSLRSNRNFQVWVSCTILRQKKTRVVCQYEWWAAEPKIQPSSRIKT